MLFFVGFALLFVIGVILLIISIPISSSDSKEALGLIGVICMLIGGAVFLLLLISLPFFRIETHANIAGFDSVQQTVNIARIDDKNFLENATMQLKIIEKNEWLAYEQYCNKCVNGWLYGWWIPDEIMDLKPIE